METLLHILDWPMEKPAMYGWFHQMWLIIPLIAAWLLCRKFTRSAQPQVFVRQVIFNTAVVVAVLELLHQINYNLTWQDGALRLDMQWYAFPFQFCTTPMYAGLLTGIFKKGRVHDALCAYLATYAVFAGLAVMLYPSTIFTNEIITNIHGMVCHASMLTIGIFLYYTKHVPTERSTLLQAVPVFTCFLTAALFMNEIAYRAGLMDMGHTFNMFFISPYCEPTLPVYSIVQAHVAYPWCLVVYISVFTLAAYMVLLTAKAIARIARRHRTHRPLTA